MYHPDYSRLDGSQISSLEFEVLLNNPAEKYDIPKLEMFITSKFVAEAEPILASEYIATAILLAYKEETKGGPTMSKATLDLIFKRPKAISRESPLLATMN